MNPWRLIRAIVAVVILAGAVFAFYPKLKNAAVPKPVLRLGTAERADLTLKVTVAGTVVPQRKALITPPYHGYIQRLHVKVGDNVRAGSPIVSITPTVAATGEEIFPLRSPISGRVVQINRDEGEYVSSQVGLVERDSAIVRVDDISKLFVQANVPEIDVVKLKYGQAVIIRSLALSNMTFDGRIIDIAQAAKEQSQWERSKVEFPVKVVVENNHAGLMPGMSTVLDIIVREAKGALTLRHEFIEKDGERYYVTTASGERKTIEVGMQNEEAFEVKSGVVEGESIRQVDFMQMAGTNDG